jgi:hypothetical protein
MGYLIFMLTALLVFAIVYIKRKNKRPRLEPGGVKNSDNKVAWGCFIKTPQEPELSCCMIKKIRDTPFPVHSFSALPRLPVSGCDLKICRCRYHALNERRIRFDRRSSKERRAGIRNNEMTRHRRCAERRKGNRLRLRN